MHCTDKILAAQPQEKLKLIPIEIATIAESVRNHQIFVFVSMMTRTTASCDNVSDVSPTRRGVYKTNIAAKNSRG